MREDFSKAADGLETLYREIIEAEQAEAREAEIDAIREAFGETIADYWRDKNAKN